ncbi:hypothetical protein GCM10011378_11350 [Hymenobacter glacieicola]|uniref:Uncharacterized protein n=1 Tax=Hymenobacter glacieicola TaxID=1562124 RepID=A0ABQ1WPV8_9BACT|nr:hypothetical protein GCM10011378_11350 [Hymenobacter glacieicola]
MSTYLSFFNFLLSPPVSLPSSVSEPQHPKPPGLPSWRAWYWLVLAALGAEVAFFTYLTRLFA